MKAPFNESSRLIFIKSRGVFNDSFVYYLGITIACICFCLVMVSAAAMYASVRYEKGLADGARKALDTSKPSEELELACAGLWVGEQNRKHYQK